MVSVGIGGVFGGIYGPAAGRVYVGAPRVGIRVGMMVPPPGARVRNLPEEAVARDFNGITYYYFNNMYFRERTDGGYEVVDAPLGADIDRLPMGAQLVKIDGQYYYEKDGTYYAKTTTEDGHTIYIISGKDGQLDTESYSDSFDNSPNESPEATDIESQDEDLTDTSEITAPADANSGQGSIRPQIGDRFDRLPRDARQVTVGGKKEYVSLNGVHYKEVIADDHTVYEVVSN
ncbi:hypothetical protein GCM10027051_23370 [Niabella terrae]